MRNQYHTHWLSIISPSILDLKWILPSSNIIFKVSNTMSSAPIVSDDTIKATALAVVVSVFAVPIYHKFIKPKFKAQEVDTKKDDDAGRGRRGRLSRRPSVLEELTSVPLVLRAMLWLQCFQGLMLWLSPKIIAEVYGVSDMSPLATMLCEDLGRMWTGLHFGALVGGRRGVSTATVISSGLVFLLLSELKALLSEYSDVYVCVFFI